MATRLAAHAASAARRAGRETAAARHDTLAASYQAMAAAYGEREQVFAGVMDARRDWGTGNRR